MNSPASALCTGFTAARGLRTAFALAAAALVMLLGAGVASAESPQEPDASTFPTVDKENWPETQAVVTNGGVSVQIVNRPEGANVVTIVPDDDGITVKAADAETQSDAPLWPDHPRKDDPGADPGARQLADAIDDESVVVLDRPATTKHDGEAHANQWDAWHTTFLELVANGEPFVECWLIAGTPPVEECWITDPAPVAAAESKPADEPADQTPAGTVVETPADQPADEAPASQVRYTDQYEWTAPEQVEAPGGEPETNPLLSISQNPDDGGDIVVVNLHHFTPDDMEEQQRKWEMEEAAMEQLDAAGEPYVVCYPTTTYVDWITGDKHTVPAYCETIYPNGAPS